MAQFHYCHLVWTSHSRNLNNKVNRTKERPLRIVYNDNKLNFKEALQRDHSFTFHERNIQYHATEVCENVLSRDIFSNLAKILSMNLEAVIVFKEQISKCIFS